MKTKINIEKSSKRNSLTIWLLYARKKGSHLRCHRQYFCAM